MKRGAKPEAVDRNRCSWCLTSELYIQYHDEEWGEEVRDDRHLFERLTLEGFQSGLSWLTILRKRENFRKAFLKFNTKKIALFGEAEIRVLLQDEGIIRHRGKIEATINNARLVNQLFKTSGSFSSYLWSYAPNDDDKITTLSTPRSTSPESERLSKDLKKLGFKFVGATTIYSLMQACGMVNDHSLDCYKNIKFKKK